MPRGEMWYLLPLIVFIFQLACEDQVDGIPQNDQSIVSLNVDAMQSGLDFTVNDFHTHDDIHLTHHDGYTHDDDSVRDFAVQDFNILDTTMSDSDITPQDLSIQCQPTDPTSCEGWRLRTCRPDGTGYQVSSCPEGQVCWSDTCVDVHPNVILIMDTSGSMNQLIANGEDPNQCNGANCPSWSFPICDDISDPLTRLGRAKQSIRSVINNPNVDNVRLALQRFPQTLGLPPLPSLNVSCNSGWYSNHDSVSYHNDEHTLTKDFISSVLSEFMPVPINTRGQTNREAFLRFTDFIEEIEEQDTACTIHRDCDDGFCRNRCRFIQNDEFGTCDQALGWGSNTLGQCVQVRGCACNEQCVGRVFETQSACEQRCEKVCHTHSNPELRAIGSTPIGQSLFYAGEYFRHFVVKEGLACVEDQDCDSPDYQCIDGSCHDPLAVCRPNVIVVFSDGYETDHDEADDFFNPRIQAKRFQYGLGCTSDSDCFNAAQCVDQRCLVSSLNPSQKVCKGNGATCTQDMDCPTYTCGLAMSDCPGECNDAGFNYVDMEGYNHLLNEAGYPIPLTIHMMDASGNHDGAAVIAQAGGGRVLDVDFTSAEAIIETLNTLINAKASDTRCR